MAPRTRSLGAVLLATLVACTSGGNGGGFSLHRPLHSPTSAHTLVIGLVATLSGPDSWRGEDAFEGADLAVNVLNRTLGPERAQFELVSLDDRGSAPRATQRIEHPAAGGRPVGVLSAGPPGGLPPAESDLASHGIPAILVAGDLFGAGLLRGPLFQAS